MAMAEDVDANLDSLMTQVARLARYAGDSHARLLGHDEQLCRIETQVHLIVSESLSSWQQILDKELAATMADIQTWQCSIQDGIRTLNVDMRNEMKTTRGIAQDRDDRLAA